MTHLAAQGRRGRRGTRKEGELRLAAEQAAAAAVTLLLHCASVERRLMAGRIPLAPRKTSVWVCRLSPAQ